jgi:DNA-binding NarL/FixJ family response regulator
MSNRIVIISNHLMFGYGLECLLLNQKEMAVVGRETTLGQAITLIKTVQPDIIIVDNDEVSLETIAELLRLVDTNPEVKIIQVSLQSNNLYIYHSARTKVQSVEDLVKAIKEV